METKVCKKCCEEKPIEEFSKNSQGKDGRMRNCKTCCSEYSKKWREENKDELLKKYRAYYSENKEQWARLWEEKKEKIGWVSKKPPLLTKEEKKARHKAYVENNREKIRAYRRDRYNNDPDYKIRHSLGYHVRRYIVDKKGKGTEEILGETFDNVRLHIEKQFKEGMDWNNFGEWHIDHIIPLASGTSREEYIKLNHYTNLQPLWAEENLKKGARVDEEEGEGA